MSDPFDPKGHDYNFIRERKSDKKAAVDLPIIPKPAVDLVEELSNISYSIPKPKEFITALKKIPNTGWAIVLTNEDHEFYYNFELKTSHREMPDELGGPIGDLLASTFEQEAESDEEVEEIEDEDESDDDGNNNQELGNISEPDEPPAPILLLYGHDMTPQERIKNFNQLLEVSDIDIFATWDKSLLKIINDRRYTLIKTLKERKQHFDAFCALQAKERSVVKNPMDQYTTLLEKHCTYRTAWDDFSRKCRMDPAFMGVPVAKREPAFREFILDQRGKEGERESLRFSHNAGRKKEYLLQRERFLDVLGSVVLTSSSRWDDSKHLFEEHDIHLREKEMQELFNSFVIDLRQAQWKIQELDRKAREEASLRDRAEQVRVERSAVDRNINILKSTNVRDAALEVLNAILIDHVRSLKTREYATYRDIFQSDKRWLDCAVIPGHIAEAAFLTFVSTTLFNKLTTGLGSYIEERWRVRDIISMGWDLFWYNIQKCPTLEKLNPLKELENIKRWFSRWQKTKCELAFQEFAAALSENAFITTLVTRETEARVSLSQKDIVAHVSFDEINDVLAGDSRYLDLTEFAKDREVLINERVSYLVESLLSNERGANKRQRDTNDESERDKKRTHQ